MSDRKPLETWQETGAKARHALLANIPSGWRLKDAQRPEPYLHLLHTCGVLSPRELEIVNVEDATSLLDRMRSGDWTATEVTLAYCKSAAVAHQVVNCLMDVDIDGALQRARELDETLRSTGKVIGPLHGLPISIKDLTQAKGLRHSFGFTSWAEKIAEEDASVVKALRDAGAVIYVKTTMPQTGMALETVSNLWGRTLNPHNTLLSAGGSSGGEGALNACHGAPIGIATDIGGSIRAPAAFNGLYGIRPSFRRFSYKGNIVSVGGQIAISATCGPLGRSVRDLALICKVLSDAEMWQGDLAVPPLRWVPVDTPAKTTIGVMLWDEVVMPHPPIQRALKKAIEKLKAAGHEVIEFSPYKHRHAWDITRSIYFPTAGKEVRDILAQSGEPMIPAVEKMLKGAKELTVPELMHCHREQKAFQTTYAKRWDAMKTKTSRGQPMDAILMPAMASCAFPHDFLPWWGYLSIWNLIDYPSCIMPVSHVEQGDVKDENYVPINDVDRENHDLYDPKVFKGAPVALQLVGQTFQEEKLLAIAAAVDQDIGLGKPYAR